MSTGGPTELDQSDSCADNIFECFSNKPNQAVSGSEAGRNLLVLQEIISRVTKSAGPCDCHGDCHGESDERHFMTLRRERDGWHVKRTLSWSLVKISIQLKCCVLCVKTQAGNLILKYFKFSFMMMDVFNCLTTVAATSQLGFTLGHVNISSRPACTHFSHNTEVRRKYSPVCVFKYFWIFLDNDFALKTELASEARTLSEYENELDKI